MKKIGKWIREKIKYVTEDIWHIPLGDLPRRKTFLVREIRILVLAFKGFREDKVQLRASALTFNTLLSIIPVVAIAFGIAQSFGFKERLEIEIRNALTGHEEVMDWILTTTQNFLESSSGGFIAVIGLIILIWSVMQVLNHIEKSFNHIWQIKKSRPWVRKFADYLSIMLIAPVFIVLSGSFTVYLNTTMGNISDQTLFLSTIKPALVFLFNLIPYVIIWLVFTMLYMVMPNTRVKFKSALVAGIIAGTMFQVVQLLYINSQMGVSRYSVIYGSFAAFPLFIVWMQISWLVVLMGAEISFANQNVGRYEFEYQSLSINSFQKRILTLLILNIIVKKFIAGVEPASASEISRNIQIPVRLSREILYNLVAAGLITEINIDQPRDRLYQPAMDTRKMTIEYVLSRIDKAGGDNIPVKQTNEYRKLNNIISAFGEKLKESDMNLLISEV
ncbi:MAG: YihY/virulence factor BrkB family protein [Bacteroidales bacterium]|jgi:membrane protein|nr:YihY/virulence factor BrkB family protein [Bacteroidales bacterium]